MWKTVAWLTSVYGLNVKNCPVVRGLVLVSVSDVSFGGFFYFIFFAWWHVSDLSKESLENIQNDVTDIFCPLGVFVHIKGSERKCVCMFLLEWRHCLGIVGLDTFWYAMTWISATIMESFSAVWTKGLLKQMGWSSSCFSWFLGYHCYIYKRSQELVTCLCEYINRLTQNKFDK